MAKRIQTQRRWRKIVQAQQASGLRPGEFCSKENICRTSFYAWRKRLGMAQEAGTTALPGVKDYGSGDPSKGFMQVRPPEATTIRSIRIETPNGYRVQVDHEDQGGLKQVLELVRCL